jgi:D-alanyl-lipoteichoic acid acyltransferase DltB (MBOAT superfamily)
MNTSSAEFLAFGVLAAILYNLARSVWWRQAILLVANLCFLATFALGVETYLPFVAFLAAGYAAVMLMRRPEARKAYAPLLGLMILLFVWLKKYTFLPEQSFLHFTYTTIGLSYIFFRVMHLIIEVHDDQIAEPVSPISYLNYTLNFTTLVSGPIQRYPDFAASQLAAERPPLTILDLGDATDRIAIGFFKAIVVAMVLSSMQRQAIAALSAGDPLGQRVLNGIVIAAAYPLYLYCNFSGYTDIVIGIGKLLRMRIPENFDRPFSSDNFMNFWSRWHITLSQWLKRYVYNPLLMSLMRRYQSPAIQPFFVVFALFVTFFLVGIWHGRTSVFVFFGLLQGGGVAVNQLYQILIQKKMGRKQFKALSNNSLYCTITRGMTFTFFAFSLFWFWSNWAQMHTFVSALGTGGVLAVWAAILVSSTLILAAYEALRAWALSFQMADGPVLVSRYARTLVVTAAAVVTIAVVSLLNAPAPDIVYKSF